MTAQEAVDEMYKIIEDVGTAQTVQILWPDVPEDPPATEVAWARPSVKHADGGQGSLTGGLGTAMYDAMGTLWIQVFAPRGDGKVSGYGKAQAFLNALRQHSGSVWLRRHRLEEMGQDGDFNRFDVKAEFEYYDVT